MQRDFDFFNRIIKETLNLKTCPAQRPSQTPPIQRRISQKEVDFRFFVLPPNQLASLQKKDKIPPSTEQIRNYMRKHALNNLVFENSDKLTRHFKQYKRFFTEAQIQPRITPQLHTVPSRHIESGYALMKKQVSCSQLRDESQTANQHRTPQMKVSHSRRQHQSTLTNMMNSINKSPLDLTPHQRFSNMSDMNSAPTTYRKFQNLTSQMGTQENQGGPSGKRNLKKILMRNIKRMKEMGLRIEDIFSKKPYQKPYSADAFMAIKKNQLPKLKKILQKNRYIIFDYDYYNMTPLHWGCKKGNIEIVKLLLDQRCDIDAIDILGRNALYIAAEEGFVEIVRLLLLRGATPWSVCLSMKNILEKNLKLRLLIHGSRKVENYDLVLVRAGNMPKSTTLATECVETLQAILD